VTANEWAGFILAILGILGATFKMLQWLIRSETSDLKSKVDNIEHESTSNGGESMNDIIKLQIFPLLKEIRTDQLQIKGSVSELYGWKDEHVRNHS